MLHLQPRPPSISPLHRQRVTRVFKDIECVRRERMFIPFVVHDDLVGGEVV